MSVIAGVVQAVLDEINAYRFSMLVHGTRTYNPEMRYERLPEDPVLFALFGNTGEIDTRVRRHSREKRFFEIPIQMLLVAKSQPKADQVEFSDQILALAEEIDEFMFKGKAQRVTVGSHQAVWTEGHIEAAYIAASARERHVAEVQLLVNYRMER